MKILAIDSSGLVASVAYVDGSVLRAEYTIDYKKTHSQTLLPMLDEISRMVGIDASDVDAVAVACGPGSFTGLRIGSSTAKGICLASGKPLVEVPTLAGLAYNLFGARGLICPIMDARRGQVYNGLYRFDGARLVTVEDQRALSVEELAEDLDR
ncbi:MAG: tRNA (adenosine(37)-N6)-threonylcarbamoyltransferase complex dimerization subunit type 1 TsaB, partial [Lachnospiraceae bacterium]|nr:tRNA (adenosine(37)-N6)-threonylcarbamoyltransferase complex dimerization subunit type 1 TsaB [Lachnospiraceae bacterium]